MFRERRGELLFPSQRMLRRTMENKVKMRLKDENGLRTKYSRKRGPRRWKSRGKVGFNLYEDQVTGLEIMISNTHIVLQ